MDFLSLALFALAASVAWAGYQIQLMRMQMKSAATLAAAVRTVDERLQERTGEHPSPA